MRIARARLTPFRLPLRAPLATAHGALDERRGWLLELVDEDGRRGVGEASPLPGFGLESHAESGRALAEASRALVGAEVGDEPDGLPDPPGLPRAARAAVDLALHDLAARGAGLPLASWLARAEGRAARERVPVAALLVSRDPEEVAEEARRRVAEGFTTLKLKLGSEDFERDLSRVAALRRSLGPGPALRLDVNGGWKEADAREHLRALAPFDVELVEQPVPAADVEALARLRAASPAPLAADEALEDETAVARLLELRAADVFVVKPAAVGGLRAAGRIARAARNAGIRVVITSFLDSAVGVCAALHLAAALPEGPAAGLATSGLLRDDLADAPAPAHGWLALPAGLGLGIEARVPERLAAGDAQETAG